MREFGAKGRQGGDGPPSAGRLGEPWVDTGAGMAGLSRKKMGSGILPFQPIASDAGIHQARRISFVKVGERPRLLANRP